MPKRTDISSILIIASLVAFAALAACSSRTDNKPLTREAFVKALGKCKPLDGSFIDNPGGPPSVSISIPPGPSKVPDCMMKAFDGAAIKEITINYQRAEGPDKGNQLANA
jgi:hypothetical protein